MNIETPSPRKSRPQRFLAFIKGTGNIEVLIKTSDGAVAYADGSGDLCEHEYVKQDPIDLIAEIYNKLEQLIYD